MFKSKTILLYFIAVGFLLILVLLIFIQQKTIYSLVNHVKKEQIQTKLDVSLTQRKIDSLQDKFYQDSNNKFLENNNTHYSQILEGSDVVQINYDGFTKDYHDGFKTNISYKFNICSFLQQTCLPYDSKDTPIVTFKNNEQIQEFETEVINPISGKSPVYLIRIKTNLLSHLYIYLPETVEGEDRISYRLINPVTHKGWLRQYEGEKQIKALEQNDSGILLEIGITPIHYQVYEKSYKISLVEDVVGGYVMEYEFLQKDGY
jgi:hypothetical protein